MLTVLAENKNDRSIRAIIELPASDGEIAEFRKELDVESGAEISIRYSGTGEHWYTDVLLLENNLNENPTTTVSELNLLSHLLNRMDENEIAKYENAVSEYSNDLGISGIKNIINEAYDVIAHTAGHEESDIWYDGEIVEELLIAERELLKPYPEMNKDVFWKIIADAREQSDGESGIMQLSITEELALMSPQDIILYRDIKNEYAELAYINEVIEVSCNFNKKIQSESGMAYFRCSLISQGGGEVYIRTPGTPDISIIENLKQVDRTWHDWESVGYPADHAYEIRTGDEIYDQPPIITQEQKDEIAAETMCEQTGGDSQFEQTM